MFHIRNGISQRLFAILILVAVIPVSVIGFVVYGIAQDVLISTAYMHIETIAQDHSNHLDRWFNERTSGGI
jgi:undecaprenyl pyrophosphate phosphatase UppP